MVSVGRSAGGCGAREVRYKIFADLEFEKWVNNHSRGKEATGQQTRSQEAHCLSIRSTF